MLLLILAAMAVIVRDANLVTEKARVILLEVRGNQSAETVAEIRRQVEAILKKPFSPQDVLIDLSQLGMPDPAAMRAGVQCLKEVPFHQAAFFGMYAKPLQIIRWVMKAAGDHSNIKMFRAEESARTWLGIDLD